VAHGPAAADEREAIDMSRRRVILVLGLLALAAVGGLLVALSGIIPLEASAGHWAITEWILQLGKRRSVATHTLGVPELELAEPWLVLKGAGHYESGCRPCHGSPELPLPGVARAMLPPPPYLPPLIEQWEPEELFYIVKHGIKLTGMPAWPSQVRDDEVRAMVAFLLAMPELDDARYQQLVHGGEAAPEPEVDPLYDPLEPRQRAPALASGCARCHGRDGCGRELAAFPRLAGQRSEYLLGAMQAYARDERHSGIMEPIAVGLRADEMRELADFYGGLPRCSSPASEPQEAIARGEAIARDGIPEQRVPSCRDCHGPAARRRNPMYPELAGQYADYLVLQLELFETGQRGGSSYAHVMGPVAPRLDHAQMRDVASYYASLSPPR
jgi:cytochrome c553